METFAVPDPPHVHQPLIQTIVDEQNGIGRCPSTGETRGSDRLGDGSDTWPSFARSRASVFCSRHRQAGARACKLASIAAVPS